MHRTDMKPNMTLHLKIFLMAFDAQFDLIGSYDHVKDLKVLKRIIVPSLKYVYIFQQISHITITENDLGPKMDYSL